MKMIKMTKITAKQKEKMIIDFNITNVENFLLNSAPYPKGKYCHEINSVTERIKYYLKIKKTFKSTKDDNFKCLLRLTEHLKALYFDLLIKDVDKVTKHFSAVTKKNLDEWKINYE